MHVQFHAINYHAGISKPLVHRMDGSDIAYASHPSSLYEGFISSIQAFMAGKDQEVAPKLDGLIRSSMTPFCCPQHHHS